MQDSGYAFFMAFACIWIIIGATAAIAMLKADNQKLGVGKWGLIVALPIAIPFMLALLYQVVRPFILPHLL